MTAKTFFITTRILLGLAQTRGLFPVFLKSHNNLHWLAHLQAATPCEPHGRKPRAIAITPHRMDGATPPEYVTC
jgi:hypothetical protein